MGWDIYANYDISQKELDEYMEKNNINKNDWDQSHVIGSYFENTYLKNEGLSAIYSWNKECEIHEMFDSYRVTFIRDDNRFENRRFQKELEKKIGSPFPECLKHICFGLRTADDAIEIAEGLETFFADDDCLMDFAEWLKKTSKLCSTYELSY